MSNKHSGKPAVGLRVFARDEDFQTTEEREPSVPAKLRALPGGRPRSPKPGPVSPRPRASSATAEPTRASAARPASSSGFFRIFFFLLIAGYGALVAFLAWWGGSFYATPVAGRFEHPLYPLLKPSGAIGHPLGIVGTIMMLFIFVYSLRKRSKLLQRIGSQSQWLQVHIFLGFAGPILVSFHTTGKLRGVVAIAFYSMWAMVISGIIGRYLYAKIPRTIQGSQMTIKEIEGKLAELVEALQQDERRDEVLGGIEAFLARTRRQQGGLVRALARVVLDDLKIPFDGLRIWRVVGGRRALGLRQRLRVSRLVLRQQRLLNHLAVLDASKRLFSYWHIFHKPFTVMTFLIVFLHAAVAVYLGYGPKW